jgi:hypothetical protein
MACVPIWSGYVLPALMQHGAVLRQSMSRISML